MPTFSVAIDRTEVFTEINEKNKLKPTDNSLRQQLKTTDVSRKQFIQHTVDAKLGRNGVVRILWLLLSP